PRGPAVRRTGARLPGVSPRPLRRIQPGLRSRHALRPAVGRPHRGDPDVDASTREVALRLETGAGDSRSAPLFGFSRREGLVGESMIDDAHLIETKVSSEQV